MSDTSAPFWGLYEDLPPPRGSNQLSTIPTTFSHPSLQESQSKESINTISIKEDHIELKENEKIEEIKKEEPSKKITIISELSVEAKLLAPALRRKAAAAANAQQAKQSKLKSQKPKLPRRNPNPPKTTEFKLAQSMNDERRPNLLDSSLMESNPIQQVYDPMFPNDYEELLEERANKRKSDLQREKEKERERRETRVSDFGPPSSYLEEPITEKHSPVNIDLQISGEEAFLRRARLSGKPSSPRREEDFSNPNPKKTKLDDSSNQFASNPVQQHKYPMANMGHYEEHSLQQEMNESDQRISDPTTVLLLTNMATPFDVDGELEVETANECRKFGSVDKCIVFEDKRKGTPQDELVRIFVKFRDISSSMKAFHELNQRFFDGRQVKAHYYNEHLFNRNELDAEI